MAGPTPPEGFDTAAVVDTPNPDCRITFGLDTTQGEVTRFLITLHFSPTQEPRSWGEVARFDHNPTAEDGHDIYSEGLHVDVVTPDGEVTTYLVAPGTLPGETGAVISACIEYFQRQADTFMAAYRGVSPDAHPPPFDEDAFE